VSVPRVAFFPDSFHEVNGVAKTSNEFVRFVRERQYPFFCVRTGPKTCHTAEDGFETYELQNSRTLLPLQADMSFDLLFFRHLHRLTAALAEFQPDLVHITGPSHCGFLGAMSAYKLGVPLVASWHTNLHEYAARRLTRFLPHLPGAFEPYLLRPAERISLSLLTQFYRLGRLLFAPTPELIELLGERTQRPTYPMERGVDTALFSPRHRERSDSTFVIGYVGRLSTEKNVGMLIELERILIDRGLSDYKFVVVGDGSERPRLFANMRRCELPSVLLGQELAAAYAGMDVFVFPSATDTFGNVVLESLASGVPAIVSATGGPKYLINPGATGYVAKDVKEYAAHILMLDENVPLRRELSANARRAASAFSWPEVFGRVYKIYEEAIASGLLVRRRHHAPRRSPLSSIA
jgi:glycosyltransferase involved in cell wall biosynthesis